MSGPSLAARRGELVVAFAFAFAVLLTLFSSSTALGATRTWTGLGPTNNWSDALNWSGGVIPGAADVASFDATSSKNATIAAAVNVNGVSIAAGYAGTITQNAGIPVTVGATGFTQVAGMFSGGTAAITVNGPFSLSAGTFAATSGTMSVTGSFTLSGGAFNAGTGTLSFSGGAATLAVATADTFRNVTFANTKAIAAGTTLTATGTVSLTAGSLNGTGTLAATGDVNQALGYGGGAATLLFNGAGAQTLTGASTTASGNLPAVVINKPSGTLSLAGTVRTTSNWTYSAGTLDAGTSTLVFAGGTITGSHTLNAVDLRATTSIAAGTTLTVAGSTTLTAGNLNGTGTLAATGAISQASTAGAGTGTLAITGAGAQTFTGAATTAAGNLPVLVINKPSGTLSLAGTIRTGNGWTYTAGTVDPGTSTLVFAGGTVRSAGMSLYDVIGSGGTTTLGTAMLIAHDLTVSAGTFTTSASGFGLTIQGNLTVAGTFRENGSTVALAGNLTDNGTIVPAASTLVLDGLSAQSLGGGVTIPAFNLVVANAAGVSLASNLTVTGTLTLSSGQLVLGPQLLTISSAIAGTPTNLVGGATSSLTVTGAGAGIVVPTSVSLLANLTLANANGLGLQANLTIGGTLALTAGRVDTGASTLVVGSGGSVSRTAGWVVGRLQKHAAAGVGTSLSFEIGDSGGYAPLAVAFGTVLGAGDLTASTAAGEHPDIANSALSVGQDVNRWWTIVNDGTTFDTATATFTFLAGDVDVGADPTTFIVAKRDSGTWTLPSVGTRTALSTQATGMSSFSEFAVGEPTADLGVTADDGLASVIAGDGLTHTYTITVSNGGPSDPAGVNLGVTWPPVFSQGGATPSQGSCAPIGAGPDLSCDLGSLTAGGSATVTIDYTVPASTPGADAVLVATAGSGVLDPVSSNDSATDTTTIVELAGLAVLKDDGLASVTAGDGLPHAYTITVSNAGPSDADSVILDDTVPVATTAGAPSSGLGGDCSASIGNVVHCSLPASLAPGATWAINVPYSVDASVSAQTISNTAIAVSDENAGGVSATDVTTVVASADLAVTADDGLASVDAGDGLTHTYTITVSNAGPSDATRVRLGVTWPAVFSQGAVNPSQGSCASVGAGPNLSCDLGGLAGGALAMVTIDYSVPSSTHGGDAILTATVSSTVVDPASADDSATDTTTVVELPASPPPSLGAGPNTATAAGRGQLPRSEIGWFSVAALIGGLTLLFVELGRRSRSRASRRSG